MAICLRSTSRPRKSTRHKGCVFDYGNQFHRVGEGVVAYVFDLWQQRGIEGFAGIECFRLDSLAHLRERRSGLGARPHRFCQQRVDAFDKRVAFGGVFASFCIGEVVVLAVGKGM